MSHSVDFEFPQSGAAPFPPRFPIAVSPGRIPSGGLARWRAQRVLLYIEANLAQRLGVELMASVAYVSRFHFCRAFKRTFGITLHRHVVRRRIDRAQHLLVTTTATLSEIALKCGMSDHSHLTRLFRELVGEPPSAWRKRNVIARTGHASGYAATEGYTRPANHGSHT